MQNETKRVKLFHSNNENDDADDSAEEEPTPKSFYERIFSNLLSEARSKLEPLLSDDERHLLNAYEQRLSRMSLSLGTLVTDHRARTYRRIRSTIVCSPISPEAHLASLCGTARSISGGHGFGGSREISG